MPGLTSAACLSPYECGIKFNIHFNLPLWALSFLPPPHPPTYITASPLLIHYVQPCGSDDLWAHLWMHALWEWPIIPHLGKQHETIWRRDFPRWHQTFTPPLLFFPPLHFQSLNLLSLLQFSRTTIPLIKSYNLHVSQSCLHRRFSKFQWPIANTGTFPME